MLKKVRKIRVIETLDDVFDKGQIYYECLDYPGHFYRSDNPKDIINLDFICGFGSFDVWFEELNPVKKESSPEYKLLITK